MRTISLNWPDDLLDRLESEARATRVTKSSLVRRCLEISLREKSSIRATSCFDLSRDLAGALKGLPADLADNQTYMDSFGE